MKCSEILNLLQAPSNGAAGLPSHEAQTLLLAILRGDRPLPVTSPSYLELSESLSKELQPGQVALALEWRDRRLAGEPLQYLTGSQSFLGHEYGVRSGVLVPRPETEFLVDTAIRKLREMGTPRLGFEIGAGSGAIGIELSLAFPGCLMRVSELSLVAEQVSLENARRLLGDGFQERYQILRADSPESVFEPFSEKAPADFLISNPPYLASSDPIAEDVLRHEPHEALFAQNKDPNYFYARIAAEGPKYLRPGAFVFLEIPPERVSVIKNFFLGSNWNRLEILPDLTGRDRVLLAERAGV